MTFKRILQNLVQIDYDDGNYEYNDDDGDDIDDYDNEDDQKPDKNMYHGVRGGIEKAGFSEKLRKGSGGVSPNPKFPF